MYTHYRKNISQVKNNLLLTKKLISLFLKKRKQTWCRGLSFHSVHTNLSISLSILHAIYNCTWEQWLATETVSLTN